MTDRQTGESIPCPVLVCTLPYSGYSYVIALLTAGMEHFFYGLNQSLSYLGGVPSTVKSDNMKQWVKRADRYEPTFSDAATQWGLHCNTQLKATRVAKPRDYVKKHIM